MLRLRRKHQSIGTFIDYEDNLTGIMISAIENGLYAFSFSLGNSRNFTRKRVESEDINTIMGLISRFPVIVFSFIPTMYNLCGHRNFLSWNGNIQQDKKTTHILHEITYELGILSKLGGSVITEIGSHRDKPNGLLAVSQSLNRIDFKMGYKLILMNSLDTHSNIGITFNDLFKVYNSTESQSKPYVYLGVNLAYLYVNGLYDIRKQSEIKRMFEDIEKIFPKYILSVVYLTDTCSIFESKSYSPISIGDGELWKDIESLQYLLIECESRYITILTSNMTDLEIIREISEDLFI